MKKNRKILSVIIAILCIAAVVGAGIYFTSDKTDIPAESSVSGSLEAEETESETEKPVESSVSGSLEVEETESSEETTAGEGVEESTAGETAGSETVTETSAADHDHPKAPERTWIADLEIPPYAGEAYILLNDGIPFFETEGLTPDPWEIYYDLDELGRCTLAEAVAGQETMPTSKRGSISSVKPSGWHTTKYPQSLVDGESLYNRCHLIAFGICGETKNKYNLVTGTRYFNTSGINSFENMIIDYIRETGNHVRMRVTPVFTGDNLVCDGQVTEAWSIEDEGEGICFCLWSYNVQPGIEIDYLTGDNWLQGEEGPVDGSNGENGGNADGGNSGDSNGSDSGSSPAVDYHLDEDISGTFILNVRSKKIHTPECGGAVSMSEKNRAEYEGSYNELIDQGYEPDQACSPWEH